MKKILVSSALALTLAGSAFASVNSQTGCGLGSQLIKNDDSALMLSIQASLNGLSSNQTFGITSGTLGCKQTKVVMNERAEKFVAANMDQLSKDIAKGQGETIETLAELLEVEDSASFAKLLQDNYSKIYTSSDVTMAEVLDNMASL